MKILLTFLLLYVSIYAETTEPNKTPSLMECEMIIEMFNFGIEQGNPVSKDQVIGVIEACDGQTKHKNTVDTMKKLLGTI